MEKTMKNDQKITENTQNMQKKGFDTSTQTSTLRQQIFDTSAHKKNNSLKFKGIKPYFNSSIGNKGVSTLRQQTDNKQTDTFDTFFGIKQPEEKPNLSSFVKGLKQELRLRFKNLTKQEFYIFSLPYTLTEEKNRPITYKDIALRANISESSVRDYISRLINKKIPILKQRINNKSVVLKIPEELKHLETLDNLTNIHKYVSKPF